MDITKIASQFVNLALRHDWGKIKELPADEVQILFATVSAAGFEPTKLIPGKLVGHYLDQDGSKTGETYPINILCPYKVIGRESKDHYHATGWLDCALRHARRGTDPQQLVEEIRHEIERSIPLEPIQLTPEGDLLREYPPSHNYFVDHTRNDCELSCCVGVHDYCDGWVDRTRVTKTHDALICRRCRLRVLFPKEVKTYGELRQALATVTKHIQTSA